MNANELSSVDALESIQSIPEWLRSVSITATYLRKKLDELEREAAGFRSILDSSAKDRVPRSLVEIRNEGTKLITGIALSASSMRRFQAAFERWCPAGEQLVTASWSDVAPRVGSLTLTYIPVFARLNGSPLSLTRMEERLLAALWTARGSTLSGAELAQRIWPNQNVPQKTLSVHMSHLRKKLDEFGIIIEFIQGAGYRLVLDL